MSALNAPESSAAASQHQLSCRTSMSLATLGSSAPCISSSSSSHQQPLMRQAPYSRHPGVTAAAPAGVVATGMHCTSLGLPVHGAQSARQARASSAVVPSWHAAAGYSTQQGTRAAAGTAAVLSDSWRAKVPSSMTFEEKQEVC
jgi:hypothetical protein